MERLRFDDTGELAMERKGSGLEKKRAPRGAAVRSTNVTTALRHAFFREWAERGYASMSLEAVALRAGVGKAALYRRWKSKPEMARSLIEGLTISIVPPPDTGSLRGDVAAFQASLARVLRHPLMRRILPDFHAECARSEDMRDLLQKVSASRRARGALILESAIERGELKIDVDCAIALDMMAAPIYWRVIATGEELTIGDLESNVDAFLNAFEAAK